MRPPSSSTTSATSATTDSGGEGRLPRALRRLFAALVLRPFVRWVVGLEVEGAENLPRQDPFLLVANHDSHLDTAILLTLFPVRRLARIRPVAAADYWFTSPAKRFLATVLLNLLPVDRKGAAAGADPLAPLAAALARGESLILFPEGTRGEPEVLEKFKTGAARLALASPSIPVVPVFLRNTGRSLPRGTGVLVPLVCTAVVGPRVHLAGTPREATAQLEAAVHALALPPGDGAEPGREPPGR